MSPIRWGQLVLLATFLGLVAGCGSDDEDKNPNASPALCDGITCGGHGSCNPDTGTCACDTGYAGSDCSSCAVGFMPGVEGCVAANCTDNAQCDDGVGCNGLETCTDGRCVSGTTVDCGANAMCQEPNGTCACDEGYHLDGGRCLADSCSGNDECDDGLVCNGEETCSGGACRSGTAVSCQANAACQEPDGSCACNHGFTPEGSTCVAELDVLGAWIDDWGSFHDVTYDTWKTDTSVFHITQFDNDAGFLVAQNDAANAWNPDLWSRFDWTHDGADLYYCQIVYDAANEATAEANTSADRADLATGCAGFGWSKLRVRIDVVGSWIDDWGSFHDVTQDTWTTDTSVFHITQFDNDADFLVAQNDAANAWNPDLWSRFDWTYDGADLYYCQIAYDAADEATAAANTSADRADLATGCAGFGWSKLSVRLEIIGSYADDWGYSHDVTQGTWDNDGSIFHITQFDNDADFLVAQNDAANAWNPDLWSRFDWTYDGADLYYCQVVYDAADEASAAANVSADRADLAAGCSGFPWSKLNPN